MTPDAANSKDARGFVRYPRIGQIHGTLNRHGNPGHWKIKPGIPGNSGLFSCFGAVVYGLNCHSLLRVFCTYFASGCIRF